MQKCAQFLVQRGDLATDPEEIIKLHKAGVTADLSKVLDLIIARGNQPNDFNLIAELTRAGGVKHADLS